MAPRRLPAPSLPEPPVPMTGIKREFTRALK